MRIAIELEGVKKLMASLEPGVYRKAMRRTTSEVGRKFRTTASKKVREEYTTPAKEIKSRIKTKMVNSAGVYEYHFDVSGRTINLIKFGARQLKRGGVSVRAIKRGGSRIKLRHAFIARDSGGSLRVFERVKGVKRLPIKSDSTLSVPQMFNERIVNESLDEVRKLWPSRMSHNIDYYLGKIR